MLAAHPPVETFWQMVAPGDGHLPPAVQHHLRKNERVASMIGYLERLERETARVRGDGALAGSPLGADLLDLLARQKALMAQVAGKFIQGRLADMARLIDGLDADKEIIGFETTKGEKEMLETDFDVRSQLDTERLRRPAMPPTGHEYWPFDGEYWPDEIGYYRSTVKDACAPEKMEAAAEPSSAGKEAARDAATDRKRDELIDELQAILPRIREGERKADLHFQLAELWWEKARYVSMQEVRDHDQAYTAWLESRKGDELFLQRFRVIVPAVFRQFI